MSKLRNWSAERKYSKFRSWSATVPGISSEYVIIIMSHNRPNRDRRAGNENPNTPVIDEKVSEGAL